MNHPIKSAIIGLGRAGWDLHLKPMQEHADYKITAVADPDANRRKEACKAAGCEEYADIDALLAGADCDLVAIATPTGLHYSEAKKVLLAGKHCVLEKPMALRSEEARELIVIAREKGCILTLNHLHLFLPEFHHLKKIVDSKVLGKLFHFRAAWASYARRWDWQTLEKNGGGLLNNWGTHLLSIMLPILNSKVSSISANLRHIKDRGDTEDHVEMSLKMESGATADILLTTTCAFPGVRWMLLGEKGTLVSDGVTSQLKYYDPKEFPLPPLDESMAAADRKYNREELQWTEKSIPVDGGKPIPAIYENVAEVIAGKARLISKAEDAAEIVRIIDVAKKYSKAH